MPIEIPETHTSLPEDLLPEVFGQVGYSNENGIFIISALSSPLYTSTDKNQYALFVTNPRSINQVHWEIDFRAARDASESSLNAAEYADQFVLSLNETVLPAEEGTITIKATITDLNGNEITASMVQEIITSDIIDYLSIPYIAFAGNKTFTTRLINNYKPFIKDSLNKSFGELGKCEDISELILAAYLTRLINPFFDDIEIDQEYTIEESIGLYQLHPHLVELVYDNPTKVDIINLLRFPKSNTIICGRVLSNIKKRYWPSLDQAELVEDSEAVTFITQALYNTSTLDYLGEYTDLDANINHLDEIKTFGTDSPSYKLEFKEGRKVYQTTGLPWCRAFFYGKKKITGGIYDDNNNELQLNNVRIDVFWEIGQISQEMIENQHEGYTKEFRVRIIAPNPGLPVYDQPDTDTQNANIRLKKWQVFKLLEVFETTDDSGNQMVWYQIKYLNTEKWIVAFSVDWFATFEKVVKLNFNNQNQPTTDLQGKFNFTVYDAGLYYIRTVKEDRFNNQIDRDYYDGEFGWFIATNTKANNELARVEMKSENSDAKWVKESEIVDRIRHFDNWKYDADYAHYPDSLDFHENWLRDETEQIPANINDEGVVITPQEPAAIAHKKTNCNTFSEAILVDAWEDNFVGFGWGNNASEHKLWMNAGAGLNTNNRLRILEPSMVKRMGKCIYAIEKNNTGNNLNRIYNQNPDPDEQTPLPHSSADDVKPQPWTLVQHYDNVNGFDGHMYIILDYDENSDKILVLEASSSNSTHPSINDINGPRIRGLFHTACLMIQSNDSSTHKITHKWYIDAINKWETLKSNKKGLGLVKLFIYDLKLTRPPERKPGPN